MYNILITYDKSEFDRRIYAMKKEIKKEESGIYQAPFTMNEIASLLSYKWKITIPAIAIPAPRSLRHSNGTFSTPKSPKSSIP